MRRLAAAGLTTAAALTVAAAAGSFVRIPPGQLGAGRMGWLSAGTHVRLPYERIALISESARIEVGPIQAVTPAGAGKRIVARFRYVLTPATDAGLARETASGGLGAALAPVLNEALRQTLNNPKAHAANLRRGTSVDPIGSALSAALAGKGVGAEALEWDRTGEPAHPPVLPDPTSPKRKILVVGLDAADWRIADPLIRAGRLPHLASLAERGARAPLRSYAPMISPLIWTTLATGVGPEVHGVCDFLVMDGGTGKPIPITSRFRRVKALWNIFSDAGLTSGFAGWWASYPAEPVRGYLVTDLLGFSMNRPGGVSATEGLTWPGSYFGEIRPKLVVPPEISYPETARILDVSARDFEQARDTAPPQSSVPGAPPAVQDPVWHVRKVLAATRNYETIALDLLHKGLDMVAVYFEGIDMIGHRFQHCMPPRMAICSQEEFERSKHAVASFYEYQDEVLGRLLAASPGRTVLVVSDHGFRSGEDRPQASLPYTTGQPVDWHYELGVVVLSGPGVKQGALLKDPTVYDIAPTLLALAGLPAAEDMPGRVLEEAFEPGALPAARTQRISSYEDTGAPRETIAAAASPEAQQEMVEALSALGYIGPVERPTSPREGRAEGRTENVGHDRARAAPGPEGANHEAAEREGAASAGRETTRPTYHRNLATYFLKSGRPDDAEAELREANRLQPLPKTYELLSEIHARRNEIDQAVGDLESGLTTFKEMDEEAVLWILDLRLGQGRVDLAEQSFAHWRERLTRPGVKAVCEGKIAEAHGEDERATALYLEALRAEPSLSQAAVAAAPILEARGRLAELEPPIVRALAAERRLDEYQNLLGVIRLGQRRYAEALEAGGRALEVAPANPRFLENYAAAALAAGRGELAAEKYRAALGDPGAAGSLWAGYGQIGRASCRERV